MKILSCLVLAIWYAFSLLPMWVHYVFSDILYFLIYHLVGYRKALVRRHLAECFPEKSDKERQQIEKDFYHWFCDYIVETIKLLTISKKNLMRRMTFKGSDVMDDCIHNGQSCAIYLGHYCNWEWVTSLPLWVTPDAQCGQIYHILENPVFDRVLLHLRQRLGAICIPMAETLRFIVNYRQKGQPVVIGYISDQVPFWNNIHHWLPFLNHDTPVLTGTERLTRKAGHAIFYLDMHRLRRGYYEGELKLVERHPEQTKDFELTDSYFRLLEESIRRAPQYYLWTHNRWKRTHEEYNIRYDEASGRVSLEPLEEIKKRKGLL